jgi:hypothetical protein
MVSERQRAGQDRRSASGTGVGPRVMSREVLRKTERPVGRHVKCWGCGRPGHLRRSCPGKVVISGECVSSLVAELWSWACGARVVVTLAFMRARLMYWFLGRGKNWGVPGKSISVYPPRTLLTAGKQISRLGP